MWKTYVQNILFPENNIALEKNQSVIKFPEFKNT